MTDESPSPSPNTDDRLVALLKKDAVPMTTLHERYGPLLELVRTLIGVVPNCDRYLEIWQPAFRTYNLMVPNFLNLPFSLFGIGGAPKDIVGLGMYVSSRAAECPYCSAHTCSFALRRGAPPEKVAQALVGGESFTPGELAAIAVARSLARIPCELTEPERQALTDHFSPVAAEWIVLGIVMMGFLNKFMDALSVELEPSTVAEVSAVMGADWSTGKSGRKLDPTLQTTPPPAPDSLRTKLSVLRHAPKAIALDRRWQHGVPHAWPAVGSFLRNLTGHDFPVLSRMRNKRAVRAVASMLRENLNPDTTVIGLETKALAGIIFATIVADEPLAADVRAVAGHLGVPSARLDDVARFANNLNMVPPADNPAGQAALLLARAASPSPAAVSTDVVNTCRQAALSPPAIVELIAWISVLQMLHRLSSFFTADTAAEGR
jgi:alkylhydroperoxidase family enzyme